MSIWISVIIVKVIRIIGKYLIGKFIQFKYFWQEFFFKKVKQNSISFMYNLAWEYFFKIERRIWIFYIFNVSLYFT